MGDTRIEWSQKVWNPVRGCTRVSPGCQSCYAEAIAARFSGPGQPFEGFAERTKAGGRWTGKLALIPEKLGEPLSWRKPALVFVNSMSDLFHERLSNEDIAAVFGVMAGCPQHTFQILTKRADRLPEWFKWLEKTSRGYAHGKRGRLADLLSAVDGELSGRAWVAAVDHKERVNGGPPTSLGDAMAWPWPLPNVWLGVSVENREQGLPRVDHLRAVPASVRFLSVEPLLEDLGPVDLTGIRWVICGGESGPDARPMDIAWMRSVRDQCAEAGVPYFAKQLGARPFDAKAFRWMHHAIEHGEERLYGPRGGHAATLWRDTSGRVTWFTWDPKGVGGENGVDRDLPTAKAEAVKAVMRAAHFPLRLKSKKGGDPGEWPEDLRVRQMPVVPHG